MASKVSHLVQNWIQSGPSPVASVVAGTADVPLQALAADTESYEAATAGAAVLGRDTSNPNAIGREIYTDPDNIGTAFASIMHHAQNKAAFHPADTAPEKLAAAFSAYSREVDNTPFFHLMTSSQDKQEYKSSDYNKLIDQIGSLYDGVKAEDQAKIKTAITDMAKSVFSESHSKRWKNLFTQTTLNLDNPTQPKFLLYYTSMYMSHDDNGKAGVESQQTYEVRKTEYVVLRDLIAAHADLLAGIDTQSITDWLKDNKSPEKKDPKLCFTPKYQ